MITFNAQQRDLIDNLLRDSGNDRIVRALDEPDGLFVKNLENVQGDERDVILFSVAFSANDKGVVPLNFGPLSRPGGERRLNVAITRARRQVVLYASFDPANLRAEQTTQVGTKHLKAYLELAAGGAAVMAADGRREPVVDRHRDQIAERLRAGRLDRHDRCRPVRVPNRHRDRRRETADAARRCGPPGRAQLAGPTDGRGPRWVAG